MLDSFNIVQLRIMYAIRSYYANYISEKEFYLVFTKDFFEFPVKIIENEKIMFDGIITTKSNNIAKSS